MLFKISIKILRNDIEKVLILLELLKESGIDVKEIRIRARRKDNQIVNLLAESPIFDTKQDLFKILKFSAADVPRNSENHEYLSYIGEIKQDMSWFCKQAGTIQVRKIDGDLNIDCLVEKLNINSKYINKIADFNFGTQRFFESVQKTEIYNISHDDDINEYITSMFEYFKNLKIVELIISGLYSNKEILNILSTN